MPSRQRNRIQMTVDLSRTYFRTTDQKVCKELVKVLKLLSGDPYKMWSPGAIISATGRDYPIFIRDNMVKYTSGRIDSNYTDHLDPEEFLTAYEAGKVEFV